MKKWVLYYLIISLLFGAIIYIITLFQITQEQTNEAFNINHARTCRNSKC